MFDYVSDFKFLVWEIYDFYIRKHEPQKHKYTRTQNTQGYVYQSTCKKVCKYIYTYI